MYGWEGKEFNFGHIRFQMPVWSDDDIMVLAS